MIARSPARRLRIRTGSLQPRSSDLRRRLSEAARRLAMAPNRFALHTVVLGIAIATTVTAVLI